MNKLILKKHMENNIAERQKIRKGIKELINSKTTNLKLKVDQNDWMLYTISANGKDGKYSEEDYDEAHRMKLLLEKMFNVSVSLTPHSQIVDLDIIL